MKCWLSAEERGLDNLTLGETDIPVPTTQAMIIEVHAAALNFSDLLMIEDTYQIKPPRPFTPGQEVAGIVTATSADSAWKVGDRVCSKVDWGGFAEYAVVRTDMAIPIPDNLNFSRAAALPVIYTTAMVALCDTTQVQPDQTVLVHGAAGGVGLAAVQVAKAKGARVVAVCSTPAKMEIARQQGADEVVCSSDTDWVAQVKQITGELGVDIIVDPVGGSVSVDSLRCLARNGSLLVVGFASGPIPKFPAHHLLLKRASINGVYWNHDEDGPMLSRVNQDLMAMLDAGKINPVVDDAYALIDLPRALQNLQQRTSTGKLVIRIRQ